MNLKQNIKKIILIFLYVYESEDNDIRCVPAYSSDEINFSKGQCHVYLYIHVVETYNLKIPCVQSKAINRRTNNPMIPKRKYEKTSRGPQTLHRKPNVEEHEHHCKQEVTCGAPV